jgi:hypothetical protein
MGAWAYCRKCSGSLDRSTIRQVIEGVHTCYACHHDNPPNIELVDALEDMEERITQLETRYESGSKGNYPL